MLNEYRYDSTDDALDNLFERYVSAYQREGKKPQTEYIDDWDVSVYRGEVRYGMIEWLPLRRQIALDFTGTEQGLELSLHQGVQMFYQRYFAADLHVLWDDVPYTLSQVLSAEDEERLLRNLIGHVLMKDRLQQPTTVFIGTSDSEDDVIVSVDNQTGVVGLEYVGKPQHVKLADTLAEFLRKAQPHVVNHN